MAESDEPDDLYVERVLGEDLGAMAVLAERYYPSVYRFGFKLGRNEHDAQDIAQETFLRAARNLRNYVPGTQFKSWLFGIAVNVSREMARKNRSHECIDSPEALQYAEIPASSHGLEDRFGMALRSLSVEERSAVVLVYEHELNHREAARVCGCAESTISWRLFLAKRKLKKWMERHER